MARAYDSNIIYNIDELSPVPRSPDTKLSLQFVKYLVRECGKTEYDGQRLTCYYHQRDALPGRNVFDELTRVVESSRFTILILTKGFVKDRYSKFKRHHALKILIERKSEAIIPVVIGLETFPDEFNTYNKVSFLPDPASWDTPEGKQEMDKLLERLTGQDDEVIDNRNSLVVQERGDNRQTTDNNLTLVAEETLPNDGDVQDRPPQTIQDAQDEFNQQEPNEVLRNQLPDRINPKSSAGRKSADRQKSLSKDTDLAIDLGPSQRHIPISDFIDKTSIMGANQETSKTVEGASTPQTNNGQVGSEGIRDKGLPRTLFDYFLLYDG